jgi:hypothetical protein
MASKAGSVGQACALIARGPFDSAEDDTVSQCMRVTAQFWVRSEFPRRYSCGRDRSH